MLTLIGLVYIPQLHVRLHTAKCIGVAELISKSPAVGVGNASEPSADVTIRGSA